MRWIGSLVGKRPVGVLIAAVLVMIVMITGAANMKLATGNDTLMSSDSRVYKDNLELEKYFGGETIVLLNTSNEDYGILSPSNLQRMHELGDALGRYNAVYTFVSPSSIVDQLLSAQSKASPPNASNRTDENMPVEPEMLRNLLFNEGKPRPILQELIPDSRHSVIMIKLKGGIDDAEKSEIVDVVRGQLRDKPFERIDTVVTGKPVLDAAVHANMRSSMKVMIGIAVLLMFAVLTLVFHVRWRVIAIPVILTAVFATLGLMGYVGIPMTMVSMAVFPILIGLGVDYAIQFQNRYEEEIRLEHAAGMRGEHP